MYFTTSSVLPVTERQQRGHELHRIVRLQISRVISQQCIGRRMRLVETVARELRHQIENFLGLVLGEAAFVRAGKKTVALLGHLHRIFLAHCPPQQVGFAQRIAGQHVGDLHDLFLVDDDTQGFLQQLLQLRQLIFDPPPSPLALDEVVDHAALDRAGTIDRVQGRQVFHRARLVAPQHVAHALGFKLEDA